MIWRLFKSGFNRSARDSSDLSSEDHSSGLGKPQLVEKGFYFGRPVRLYSDGTLKAASREGWIKFSSFEEFVKHFDSRRLPEHHSPDDNRQ